MDHKEKIKRLSKFKDENEFRFFLIDLLKRINFQDVQHTHRYGQPELGKDIIAKISHEIEGEEWYAFVVKKGKILGGTNDIETIKNQIKQAFEYDYLDINGKKISINRVKVVTNETLSYGAQDSIKNSAELKIYSNYSFWWNESIIDIIDKNFPEFWLPGDIETKDYIKSLQRNIRTKFELKELSLTKKIPETKLKKLLDVFIKPYLTEYTKVKNHQLNKTIKPSTIPIEDLLLTNDCFIIEGSAGAGKTRLLNQITFDLTDNAIVEKYGTIPIALELNLLRDNQFNIKKSIKNSINNIFSDECDHESLLLKRHVLIIDSVDDLSINEISLLIQELSEYCNKNLIRFILSARTLEHVTFSNSSINIRKVYLENFNSKQVEAFVMKYFEDLNRGKRFIEILRESNILEKLPATPLTITLMSLLYEDTDYEIPATITDIFSDFVNVLLGKLEIKSRTQLLDLELKKRILSSIALTMLKNKKFEISKGDFFQLIDNFLKPKGMKTVNVENVYNIISKSALLYESKDDLIGFKHQSFLEYFSALELYKKHYSYMELIEKFNDVNWQNTTIFYAGFSKDMPDFITSLVKYVPENNIRDWFLNISGMGYLAQALYMTDTEERIKLIEKALDNMIYCIKKMQKTTSEKGPYSKMPLNLITAIVSFWFTMNFKSITLIECLETLYDILIDKNKEKLIENNFEIGFKLFLLASTLTTKYIDKPEKFEHLLELNCFIKDPVLMVLGDMFLDIEYKTIGKDKRKKIKKEIKRYQNLITCITKEPAYRFKINFKSDEILNN